jgi:hypothetical protein
MTLAEIAAALGRDERTVRRDLVSALAKLRAGLDLAGIDPDRLDLERFCEVISDYYKIPRRFSAIAVESEIHAPRVTPPTDFRPSPAVGGERVRAGHLSIPQRFNRRRKP